VYLRSRLDIEPVAHGGGQERGRRSGTENVAGAVGLAAALEIAERARLEGVDRVAAIRDEFVRDVLSVVPGARLTGPAGARLAGSASFTFDGTSGESIVLELERRGIVCSSGSACAAGRDEPSHVLLAMGVAPELAQTAVRFGFGDGVTGPELAGVAVAVGAAVTAVRAGRTN
jgi:cysteine desulfurase